MASAPRGRASSRKLRPLADRLRPETLAEVIGQDHLLGPEGTLFPDEYEMTRPEQAALTGGGDSRKMFLRSRANSIEGGTSEILRNIMGERVLGLPGEPRVDKDLPWASVPRS